jgi:hypothetical protein
MSGLHGAFLPRFVVVFSLARRGRRRRDIEYLVTARNSSEFGPSSRIVGPNSRFLIIMGADNDPHCAHGGGRPKSASRQADRPRAPRRALALSQTRREGQGDERAA